MQVEIHTKHPHRDSTFSMEELQKLCRHEFGCADKEGIARLIRKLHPDRLNDALGTGSLPNFGEWIDVLKLAKDAFNTPESLVHQQQLRQKLANIAGPRLSTLMKLRHDLPQLQPLASQPPQPPQRAPQPPQWAPQPLKWAPQLGPHSTATLPILTSDNHAEYAGWHDYYHRVYGTPVGTEQQVDLNTFTWFYSFAPLPSDWVCAIRTIRPGWEQEKKPLDGALIRFTGRDDSPEVILSRSGAFVKRPIDKSLLEDKYLEVLRTNHGDGAGETSECWFYHTIGSGFWIKNEGVRRFGEQYRHTGNDLTELVMPVEPGKKANDLAIEVGWGPREAIQRVELAYDSNHVLARA